MLSKGNKPEEWVVVAKRGLEVAEDCALGSRSLRLEVFVRYQVL
jgi:hypothetical protein